MFANTVRAPRGVAAPERRRELALVFLPTPLATEASLNSTSRKVPYVFMRTLACRGKSGHVTCHVHSTVEYKYLYAVREVL